MLFCMIYYTLIINNKSDLRSLESKGKMLQYITDYFMVLFTKTYSLFSE